MEPVPSPCVGICSLDPEDVCTGCGRTLDEIAEWSSATPARREGIKKAASLRLMRGKGFKNDAISGR